MIYDLCLISIYICMTGGSVAPADMLPPSGPPTHPPCVQAAGFCILFILFSLFLIPETKGVPLEQVQEVLRTHWLWGRMQPNGGAPGSGRAEPTASGEVELGEPAKVRSTGQPGEVEGSEAKA